MDHEALKDRLAELALYVAERREPEADAIDSFLQAIANEPEAEMLRAWLMVTGAAAMLRTARGPNRNDFTQATRGMIAS